MNTKTISSKEEFGELFCRILKERGISNYKMSEDLKGVIDISSLRLYAKGINFPRTRERLNRPEFLEAILREGNLPMAYMARQFKHDGII